MARMMNCSDVFGTAKGRYPATERWTVGTGVLLMLIISAPASAQWVQQSFQLESGWNTIFVEVDPYPQMADELFAGHPIETVWKRADHALPGFGPDCGSSTDPDCVAPRPGLS